MARIDQYSTRQPSRTDILLGTDEPTGRTSNFSLADLEDFLLMNKGDRKIPIEQRIDLTSSEPENPVNGGRYLNTVTGTSSITSTAVVEDYIYELRAGEWFELIPVEGFTLWDKSARENITYAGTEYGWVSDTISGAQLTNGLDSVNNSLDQNFTFDENGNITGFSQAFTNTVNTTVAGEGFATASSVSQVGVDLNTLTGNFNSKVIDDNLAFAGIPHTFRQDDAPASDDEKFIRNSVWYDTNDGNKAYVLEPQSETPNAPLVWVEATDERLGELITEVGAQKNILIDTNGHVSGMTMGNFGPDRSYISFLADRFKIYTYDEDTAGGTVSNPFVVENGVVKISELATRDITVGDVPPEAQSTVIFATTSNGVNASTSKFDTDSGGNVTLTRTHVFLANTRWVNGDNLDSSWVFERIAGVDGTSVNIEGSVNDVASLPTTGNSPGDGYLISGNLYVWDGSQWNNAGNIQGPDGNDGITPSFGLDYQNGVDGSFHSYIYKVSDTQPARPPSTGTAFYQGSFDGVSEIIPNGWTDSPSVSTEDVEWVSKAIYENTKTYHPTTGAETTTWTKRTTSGHDWSEPVKIYQKGDVGDTGTPGADAYTVVLANESHTVPVSAVSVHNYAGSGTSIVAYKGGTQLQGRVSGTPGAGQFTVTPNTSGIGIDGSPSVPSGSMQVTIPDMRDMTNNTASVTYSINLEDNITITKKQTFTKSQDGANGTDGTPGESIQGAPGSPGKKTATGLIFYQVSSTNAPSLPIAGNASFDFTDGSVSGLTSNWNTVTPSLGPGTSTSTFWSSRYYAVETNANSNIGSLTFDTPVSMYSFDQVVTFTALGSPGDTIIDGGRIRTGTLSANTLSTGTIDADEITIAGSLNSSNYDSEGDDGFAAAGTEIDLSNGSIHSKNFKIDPDGSTSFGGTHGAGSIGNWNITTEGTLLDDDNKISLDPGSKSITMRDSSGDLKVRMSAQTSLSSIDSASINFNSSSQGGYGIVYNFNLTNSSQNGTNYVTQNKYSPYSALKTLSKPGAYELDPDRAGTINSTMHQLSNYILEDMPVATNTTPTSLTSSQISALNSSGAQNWGYTTGIDLSARAIVKMYIQVVNGQVNNLQLVDEHLLAEKTIYGEYSRSYWLPSLFHASGWGRVQSNGGGSVSGTTYAFEDYPPVLNIPTAGDYRVRFRLELSTRPYKSVAYNSSNLNGLTSINGYQVAIPTTAFTPISGSVDLLLPSNFSEISGGGVQVVTNADQYVKMPRNDVGSSASSTVLSASGGVSKFLNNQHGINAIYADGNVEVTRALDAQFLNADYLNDLDISSLAVTTNISHPGSQSSTSTRHNSVQASSKNYVVLPGGVIMQWGHVYDTNTVNITFPLTFPNGVGSVVCSTNRSSSGNSGFNHVYSYGRSGCNLVLDSNYGFWIAIGS